MWCQLYCYVTLGNPTMPVQCVCIFQLLIQLMIHLVHWDTCTKTIHHTPTLTQTQCVTSAYLLSPIIFFHVSIVSSHLAEQFTCHCSSYLQSSLILPKNERQLWPVITPATFGLNLQFRILNPSLTDESPSSFYCLELWMFILIRMAFFFLFFFFYRTSQISVMTDEYGHSLHIVQCLLPLRHGGHLIVGAYVTACIGWRMSGGVWE